MDDFSWDVIVWLCDMDAWDRLAVSRSDAPRKMNFGTKITQLENNVVYYYFKKTFG